VKIQTLSPFIRWPIFVLDEAAGAPASRANPPRRTPFVGSKQGNVVATQNLWNEAGQLLKTMPPATPSLVGCLPDMAIQ